jgi:hypothetical protein
MRLAIASSRDPRAVTVTDCYGLVPPQDPAPARIRLEKKPQRVSSQWVELTEGRIHTRKTSPFLFLRASQSANPMAGSKISPRAGCSLPVLGGRQKQNLCLSLPRSHAAACVLVGLTRPPGSGSVQNEICSLVKFSSSGAGFRNHWHFYDNPRTWITSRRIGPIPLLPPLLALSGAAVHCPPPRLSWRDHVVTYARAWPRTFAVAVMSGCEAIPQRCSGGRHVREGGVLLKDCPQP